MPFPALHGKHNVGKHGTIRLIHFPHSGYLKMSELLDLLQNESAGIVAETLDFWLYECSLDEAPDAEEVARWRDILAQRGGKFTRLADLCQTWLNEESA